MQKCLVRKISLFDLDTINFDVEFDPICLYFSRSSFL